MLKFRSFMTDAQPGTPKRLLSLDAFRGATIASMVLVNNAGDGQHVYTPFEHADWHGWTFTDLIFPFFLWIVGVSITLSFARRVARGDDRGRLMVHVVRRSVLIYLIGFLMVLIPYFRFATVRIPGVLARIAVCYLCAATIFLFSRTRGRLLWIAGLLGVYWALMKLYPVPGYGGGVLTVPGNFAWYVDGLFLQGHMYSATKTWDPEGIVSTLPAIATTLLGIFAGQMLQVKRTVEEKTVWLFFSGVLLLFAGLIVNTWLPINKKLWTPSFTLFMAGMASVVFACCYWIIDVKGQQRWARPFAIYGMNAITVFALSGLIAKFLGLIRVSDGTSSISLQRWLFLHLYGWISPPELGSLLYSVTYSLLFFGLAYLMYRRQWIVRI